MYHLPFISTTCEVIGPCCPVQTTIYGYAPLVGFNAFFVAAFALVALANAWARLAFQTYFFAYILVVGCISEAIGYTGRLLLWRNPFSSTGFEMQISCLIFAPSFIAAGIYLSFKYVVLTVEPTISAIPPHLYTWIFISCDTVSLTLQAVGGGLAGSAGQNARQRSVGTNLMIAGIVFQVATLLVFIALVVAYACATWKAWDVTVSARAKSLVNQWRFRLYTTGLGIATTRVLARCVYRVPELTGGWGNPVMRNETSFIAMEGFMILLAAGTLAVLHPGRCIPLLAARTKKEQNTVGWV